MVCGCYWKREGHLETVDRFCWDFCWIDLGVGLDLIGDCK